MEVKLFEVRDTFTFLTVIAIRCGSHNEQERYLWSRAGYGREAEQQANYVLLSKLTGGDIKYNPLTWGDRTMGCAHAYIRNFWDELKTGQVIDVEYILGESDTPKESERFVYA